MSGNVFLSVSLDVGMGERIAASIEIDGPYLQSFEPIDTCDEPVIQWATGAKSTVVAKVVMRERAGFADELAKILSAQILQIMSSRDTHNGYPIERKGK